MKLILLAALAASAGFGCGRSDPPKPGAGDPPPATGAPAQPGVAAPAPAPKPADAVPAEYAGDIEKLCDVVRRSGVAGDPAEDRRLPIANWLAANLTTAESRQFLARIQPLVGDQKADALAAEWRSPR